MAEQEDRAMMEEALAEVVRDLRKLALDAWFSAPWEGRGCPFES